MSGLATMPDETHQGYGPWSGVGLHHYTPSSRPRSPLTAKTWSAQITRFLTFVDDCAGEWVHLYVWVGTAFVLFAPDDATAIAIDLPEPIEA